jgi:hypothetical protein
VSHSTIFPSAPVCPATFSSKTLAFLFSPYMPHDLLALAFMIP